MSRNCNRRPLRVKVAYPRPVLCSTSNRGVVATTWWFYPSRGPIQSHYPTERKARRLCRRKCRSHLRGFASRDVNHCLTQIPWAERKGCYPQWLGETCVHRGVLSPKGIGCPKSVDHPYPERHRRRKSWMTRRPGLRFRCHERGKRPRFRGSF